MEPLRPLIESLQVWWHGLSPGLRNNLLGSLLAGIILAILGYLWKTGSVSLRRMLSHFRREKEIRVSTKEEADNQRGALLDMVEHNWIRGFLEKSLYQEVLLDLDVEEKAKAIHRPWDLVLQRPDGETELLPPSTDILQIFDDFKHSLLILGDPGSGKTITLLDLARQLIQRARQDPSHPLPVVFNLASWRAGQSLDEWLVAELESKYRVPRLLGRYWAAHRELLLLLDGLDEVPEKARAGCVQAISAYQDVRTQLAICSRRTEYEQIATEPRTRLALNGAIEIQPLSDRQIFAHMQKVGASWEQIRIVAGDPDLLVLARTPLMLSVILLAYGGERALVLDPSATHEEKRTRIFHAYLRRVFFHHRRADHPWTPGQSLRWLRWLAWGLRNHNESLFLLEMLQPSWLQETTEQRRYMQILTVGGGLVLGTASGLLSGLLFGLLRGLSKGLQAGLIIGVLGGLLNGLTIRLRTRRTITLAGREIANIPSPIVFIATLRWNRQRTQKALTVGLQTGLLIGLPVGLTIGSILGPLDGMRAGLVSGLVAGLTLGSWIGLKPMPQIERSSWPNEITWTSGQTGLIVGLLYWLTIGLLGAPGGILFGLTIGFVAALLASIEYGGQAFLQHWALRFALWQHGHTPPPWEYVRFLDYAVDRILLRRVGGGWIFIHRLFMEHIASLDDDCLEAMDQEWRARTSHTLA